MVSLMPWRNGHTAAMIGLSVMLPFSDDHLRQQERHPAETTSACTTVGIANMPRNVGAKYVGRKPIATMTSRQIVYGWAGFLGQHAYPSICTVAREACGKKLGCDRL